VTPIQKRIINHLLEKYKKDQLVKMEYHNLYDICKLYGVVNVSEIWNLTDILFNEYRIRMNKVQQELYNIE
jgi:hypothetical protein